MIHLLDAFWFLPLLLYAETHYRFKYFFSFLRKREPELIADAPHHIEPGESIPLLLLAKDAHHYQSILHQVTVDVRQGRQKLAQYQLLDQSIPLREQFWWRVFTIVRPSSSGWISLNVSMTLESNGKTRTYFNDNHRTSSHRPLQIYLASDPLPRFEHMHFGDAHTHSNYTDDQVEFGSPLQASRELCKSMGLSFFCVTDHSYDLDDKVDDYLTNDPELPKWKALQIETGRLNEESSNFVIVRGEEVSCRNSNNRNVHLLLFGNSRFFHGSGDGAERWLRTASEHSVDHLLSEKEIGAVAYAAHPLEHVPLLQRLLLKRDRWLDRDLRESKLTGFQIANGTTQHGFWNGYGAWIRGLLEGRRQFIIAGNDAHGNFNRFRQLSIPFLKIKEMNAQIFGKMRTAIIVKEPLTEKSVLEAFRKGRCQISDGPVMSIEGRNSDGESVDMGEEILGKQFHLRLMAVSSPEFGELEEVKLYQGILGERSEKLLLHTSDIRKLRMEHEITVNPEKACYIRAEAYTHRESSYDGKSHFCMSNPIWLLAEG